MNRNELIQFNPILAKALAENKDHPQEVLEELVAALVRVGAEPSKIYATIKTGRMLTEQNMKLLTKADLKEWRDACREYDKLEKANEGSAKKRER